MGYSAVKNSRIAIHYIVQNTYNKPKEVDFIQNQLLKIKLEIGNLYCVSTSTIMTKNKDWQSVVESDWFYQDVILYDDINHFINDFKN